jgi:hypothetical protein
MLYRVACDLLTVSGSLLPCFEWFSLQLAALLHQDLDFSFSRFQLLTTGVR